MDVGERRRESYVCLLPMRGFETKTKLNHNESLQSRFLPLGDHRCRFGERHEEFALLFMMRRLTAKLSEETSGFGFVQRGWSRLRQQPWLFFFIFG